MCRGRVERQVHLRALIKSAVATPSDPDWTGFWAGVQARLAREKSRPIGDPWWVPFWKPFWGHPRLAVGGVMAAVLASAVFIWPGGDPGPGQAWADPVVVQDVATPDPERSVMVYSTPDSAPDRVTVIWLFSGDSGTDES